MSKKLLRERLIAQRQALDPLDLEQRSEQLCLRLVHWLEEQGTLQLGIYRSFRQEISLAALEKIWPAQNLYYPIVDPQKKSMKFHRGPLVSRNVYGIEEPAPSEATLVEEGSALLVPALAFDQRGHRLGYGAGYYDRYLAGYRGLSVGICLSEFLLASLPHERHDQPVVHVATEESIRLVKA